MCHSMKSAILTVQLSPVQMVFTQLSGSLVKLGFEWYSQSSDFRDHPAPRGVCLAVIAPLVEQAFGKVSCKDMASEPIHNYTTP